MTIAVIHWMRVMFPFGLMSIFLDNSFSILMSPPSVFDISLMVIDPINSAILRHPVCISGLSDNLVYPSQQMLSSDNQSATGDLFAGVLSRLRFFLAIS